MGEPFEVTSGCIGDLFWNVADGVVVCRPGQVLAWNPAAEAVLGVPAARAVQPGTDLTPAFGDGTGAFWALVDAGTGHAQLHTRGGSERILDASAWCLGDDVSSPTVVVLRDVTDQHRQLEGLRRLNVLARDVLGEPVLEVLLTRLVDAARDLAGADFSALLLLREGSEEETAHFVYNAPRHLFPERLPRVVGLLAVPIASRTAVRVDDIRGHPAGVGIPAEHPPVAALLAVPVLLGNQVAGEVAVANRPGRPPFDDVDEAIVGELAVHAAMALSHLGARQAREQMQANRRALLDLALHNVRTPLSVAKGFLSAIRVRGAEMPEAEREQSFEAIARAHERIQAVAEGALLDAPLRRGVRHRAERIQVADVVDEVRRELDGRIGEVRVVARVQPGTPTAFVADRRLVREMLDNLVVNAIQHTPPGDTVAVTARDEGGSVRFDVSDPGPGIPPEEQSRVFEQFYRTRQAVADGVPGSGLGLWTVRRLAEVHGGTVGLSSRTGQGTTFWLTLPLEPVPEAPPAPLG